MGFVHPRQDHEAGRCSEGGDGVDRRFDGGEVGEDAGEEGADGEAAVAPQAVDADGAGAPGGVGDVADRGEEGGVDHGGSDAEHDGAGRPGPEAGDGGHPGERGGLGEHAAGDEGFAADAVGEPAGVELAEAPGGGVEGGEDADASDREAGGGEEDGEQAPGEAVVEVVDQPGLRARRQRLVAERGEPEDLAGRQPVVMCGAGGGVVAGFVAGVGVGLAHRERGQAEAEGGVGEAEVERCGAQAVFGGDPAGGEGGDGDGAVAGGFVEAHGEPAAGGADEVDLHDHGGRPGEPLVDTEQDVGEHDPAPGWVPT